MSNIEHRQLIHGHLLRLADALANNKPDAGLPEVFALLEEALVDLNRSANALESIAATLANKGWSC